MRKLLVALCLVTVSTILAVFVIKHILPFDSGKEHSLRTHDTGVTIEQVRALACLMTNRVEVADVLETELRGRTGSAKVALLVKGDFLLGVDLSSARFESVDQEHRTAVLLLPQPTVTSPRLDQDRTRVFTLTQSGLWQLAPGDGDVAAMLLNRGYREAQQRVSDASLDPSLIARSRTQAETTLTTVFSSLQWAVTVKWQP